MLIRSLKQLFGYRELLVSWALRDIKVRYKQTILGIGWAILQPFVLMVVFTIVFSKFARVPSEGNIPYPIFSYCALLPWTFFSNSLSFATQSIINNSNLVRKIYFPREIFPLAAITACLVDFGVASTIFIGMMVYYHISVSSTIVLLPLILLLQIIFTVAVALVTSAVTVFYRDIRFVVPLGVRVWMYLTPVIYPISMVPEKYRTLVMLNPMAGIIDGYRKIILMGQLPDFSSLAYTAAISLVLFLVSYAWFKRAEMVFADVI